MFRRFSVNFALFSIGLDAILVMLALAIAIHLRPFLNYLPFTQNLNKPLNIPVLLYLISPLIWVALLLLFSVYDGRRNLQVFDEITSLTLGSLLAMVSIAGILYLSYRDVSRLLFLVFVLLAYTGLLFWRLAYRIAFRLGNGRSVQQRLVLIVGAGTVGLELMSKIVENPYLGLKLAGFLDDDPDKLTERDNILGTLANARRIIIDYEVHDVVIALPSYAYERVSNLVAELHDLPVKVWVIPDYFHLALHKAVVEEFAGIPMFDLRAPALNDFQRLVKRAFDLFVAVLFSPFILIMMGMIAIAIRLEGPGPILLRQQRVGENGRLFGMFKFRTMVPNAEKLRHLVEHFDEEGNFIHKSSHDPRVTRVGRFLRKTSLDEWPQFLNILRGEMSLVGPRPELPYLVEQYEPWQRTRFAVPQGLTGWWQVNGRSDKPMHLHTEDDLYYVKNYSLMLDIQILLRTVDVVLRGRGAY
jgi:exopolysaccharide biosynthesis polyprenyl glycosylphosphotransferase